MSCGLGPLWPAWGALVPLAMLSHSLLFSLPQPCLWTRCSFLLQCRPHLSLRTLLRARLLQEAACEALRPLTVGEALPLGLWFL